LQLKLFVVGVLALSPQLVGQLEAPESQVQQGAEDAGEEQAQVSLVGDSNHVDGDLSDAEVGEDLGGDFMNLHFGRKSFRANFSRFIE
jgi:hypothetical protein